MQRLPGDVQDIVFPSTGIASAYDEVRDKAMGLACNHLAVNSGPAPMDLGFVQEEACQPEAEVDSWMLGAAGKGTMCCALATLNIVLEIVLTSLRRRPSGQARAKDKERLKETAKETVLPSIHRLS